MAVPPSLEYIKILDVLQLLGLGRGAFYYAGGPSQILEQRGAVQKRSRQAGNLYLKAAVEELAAELSNAEQLRLEQQKRLEAESGKPRKRLRTRLFRNPKPGVELRNAKLLEWLEECPLFVFRKEKELTLADIASRVGVTRQAVSNWEFGLRFPSPDHFCLLGELFERGPVYLETQLQEWRARRPVNLYAPESLNVGVS